MRIEWLKRNGSPRIIVFFNGWGMDPAAIRHLDTAADILTVYDYRQVEEGVFPNLESYRESYVVAWSMGVWAATRRWRDLGHPSRFIALGGTPFPIDDKWGIPARIYSLTEKGMDARGREKFLYRMFSSKSEICRFLRENNPERKLEDVCEELVRIREQQGGPVICIHWDQIYVSQEDLIIPPANQLAYWRGMGMDPVLLTGGHYPFYHFRTWEEVIGYALGNAAHTGRTNVQE